jgi:hypothetical protein
MAAGDVTQGRARSAEDYLELQAGDYCVRNGIAWVCLPDGTGPCRLAGWTLLEHEDGTITTAPSILDKKPWGDGWHGYLERGVWRQV